MENKIVVLVLVFVFSGTTAAQAQAQRPHAKPVQLWRQIVGQKKLRVMKNTISNSRATRWNKRFGSINLADLQPAYKQAFNGSFWNVTVRKQLRRMNKMDRVVRDGNDLLAYNLTPGGRVSLLRIISPGSGSSPEVVTFRPEAPVRLADVARAMKQDQGLEHTRINYDGNPFNRGKLQEYVSGPRVGEKRMSRGLRKLLTDPRRTKDVKLKGRRLPAAGDHVFYFLKRGEKETTVLTDTPSGIRAEVLRAIEPR